MTAAVKKSTSQAEPTERELLSARQLAWVLSVNPATVRRWDAGGLIPDGVRIGGRVLWRRRELMDWIDAGMPHRTDWKWSPSIPAKLEALIQLKRQEAVAAA
jgi:predicted DNA-binding transcriptional regulator AlpA